MKKTLLALLFSVAIAGNAFASTEIKDYKIMKKETYNLEDVANKKKSNKDDVKIKLNKLEKQAKTLALELQKDIDDFYSNPENREFLLKTKRIDMINNATSGATVLALSNNIKHDKLKHIAGTFAINDVLKGITNEDRPFAAFMIMTVGKEFIWDGLFDKGEFSMGDIAANAVILLVKADYVEIYRDIKGLGGIGKNGVMATMKSFFINEHRSPKALRIIRSRYDLLYDTQLKLCKIEKRLKLGHNE